MLSLTRHIVKKDFRYLWPWLSIWWVVLACSALDIALSVNLIFHPVVEKRPQTLPDSFLGAYWFFVAVDVIFLAMVVDAILKSDSPIDEKAFWRTRPIGKARMFGAKLASLILFCFVVPGVIQAAGHLVFGFSPGEFLRTLGQFVFIQGALVAAVACAAVLFPRTIQGVLFLAGLVIAWLIADAVFTTFSTSGRDVTGHLLIALMLGWWFYPGLLFATVFAVAVLMYAGQGRRAGFLALFCGLLLNLMAGLYSTPRLLESLADPNLAVVFSNPPRNDTVKLSIEPSSHTNRVSSIPFWQIYGWINNPALPELKNSVWRIVNFSSELTWPGAKPLVVQGFSPTPWGTQPAQLINASTEFTTLGYGRLAWPTIGTWRNLPLAQLNDQQLARIRKEPAKLDAKIYIESGHLKLVTDQPAAVGATWHEGMTKSRVREVTISDPTAVVVKMDAVGPWHLWGTSPPEPTEDILLLYNPKTREYLEGLNSASSPETDVAFTWQQRAITFSFANKTDATGHRLPDFADNAALARWLANARLVVLGFVPEENFYIPVTIDQFLLPAKEPADAAAMQN